MARNPSVLAAALTMALHGASAAGAQTTGPGSAPVVFACSFGAKQVMVTGTPDRLVYTFGGYDRPELKLTASRSSHTVFYQTEGEAGSLERHLRFVNGPTSYVVYDANFSGGDTPQYASDDKGVIVLRGDRRVAKLPCKMGAGFTGNTDLSTLPVDTGHDLDTYR